MKVLPVVIERVSPELDAGRFPVKSEVGENFIVEADIFAEGHGLVAARLLHRPPCEDAWNQAPMAPLGNDRWSGSFPLRLAGRYSYTLLAYPDIFGSWVQDLGKRVVAGETPDVSAELLEGRRLLKDALGRAAPAAQAMLSSFLDRLRCLESDAERAQLFIEDRDLARAMSGAPDIAAATRYVRELEVVADRPAARFSAWYELFPRSQGSVPGKGSTLREAAARLEDVAAMGFDVVYLPPVHPIGETGRKGADNSLEVRPGDPGSPWAIGNAAGGHKAIAPELGTLDDFDCFVDRAHELNLEVALDYALQCSPDHPYVREHPSWFYHRPDGTIRYAENPPKKYQDIYPINFYTEDRAALWPELKSIVDFWIGHGVRTFRVDNPHTKPFPFWEWLIREVQSAHPDVIFLAEAFTRPAVMRYLAKAGFSQSYTYFTWRNEAGELREYLEELAHSESAEYLRGNLWVNTPDILHEYLQRGGRPAFMIRLVLAATLSSLYGMYSGFELVEATPVRAGSEEYAGSEKYRIKVRDWDAPGNIKEVISAVNRIRHENPALHYTRNLRFQSCDNDRVLAYAKRSPEGGNVLFVVVSVDPFTPTEAWVQAPLDWLGVDNDGPYEVENLLTGGRETWAGDWHSMRLDPAFQPAQILRLSAARAQDSGLRIQD